MHALILGALSGALSHTSSGVPLLLGAGEAVWTLVPALVAIALVAAVMYTKAFLYICKPNEILIFTGRKRVENGVDHGPLIVMPHGVRGQGMAGAGGGRGRAWRTPIVERVDKMDTTTMSIDIVTNNAYSKGNIPLTIHAIANVKLHSDSKLLRNAIERFLGRERNEIRIVAQQTLEGALREVLAQMTPEQVNEDRLTFAENLIRSVADDLDKLGLELDTLKIQNVADDTGYLDSLGRPRIAEVLRDAENAENQAMQETTQAEAAEKQRSQTAKATAEAAVLSKGNELDRVRAELGGQAAAVEREAETAAKTARAEAEKKLQEVRAVLEEKRLQAEVIIPAEAQRAAAGLRAKGAAAATSEDGKALVKVLEATSQAWVAMGPQAKEIYIIQHLEEIVEQVVAQMKGVEVGEVSILDPGDGSGLSAYAASYPQAVAGVLRALGETVGIDVPEVMAKPPTPAFNAGRGV
jgi:flotillin